MSASLRFTSEDLLAFPDDGKRYEIIDGELYVARAPHAYHQITCDEITGALETWDHAAKVGRVISGAGIIFSSENEVIPDLVWVRRDRLAAILDTAGRLRSAPDLVVEVLSPGPDGEHRDREGKRGMLGPLGARPADPRLTCRHSRHRLCAMLRPVWHRSS